MGKSSSAKAEVVEYRMSLHVALGHEVDEVREIRIDEKVAWSGRVNTNTTLNIHQPDLFGGQTKEGGLSGFVQVLMGRPDQVLPATAASRYRRSPTDCPAFRGLTTLMFHGSGMVSTGRPGEWDGGLIGVAINNARYDSSGFLWKMNSTFIAQKIEVTATRAPKGIDNQTPGLNPDYALIGNDANPAHIIYEALVNRSWGMSGAPELIDKAVFEAEALRLFNEGFGLSFWWMRQQTIEDLITEILDHIQATIFVNPNNGLLSIRLLRDDYDIATLRHITPDNATLSNFKRRSSGEIVNEITVNFTNPLNEESESVTGQDIASIESQGGEKVAASRDYYMVRSRELATKILDRDLRASTAPLVSAEAKLDRSAWNILPGEVVLLSWPRRSMNAVVARVGKVSYGKPRDTAIRASLMQDVFSLTKPPVRVLPPTDWEDPTRDPQPLDMQLFTVPNYFVRNVELQDVPVELGAGEALVGSLADSETYDSFDYELVSESVTASGAAVITSKGAKSMTPKGVLATTLPAAANSTLPFALFPVAEETPVKGGFVFIGYGDDNQEIALVTGQSPAGWTIARGCLDTVPRSWAAGTPVWVVSPGASIVDTQTIHAEGSTARYRGLDRTARGLLGYDQAPSESVVVTARPHLPLRPANVSVNNVAFGSLAIGSASTVVVRWATRNRLTEDSQVLLWSDGSVQPEYRQETVIRVYDAMTNALLKTYGGLWTETSASFNRADLERYQALRFEVLSRRNGEWSLAGHSVTVTGLAGNPSAPGLPDTIVEAGPPPSFYPAPGVGAFAAQAVALAGAGGSENPAIEISGTPDNLDMRGLATRYRRLPAPDPLTGVIPNIVLPWAFGPTAVLNGDEVRFLITGVAGETEYEVQVAYVVDDLPGSWRNLGTVLTTRSIAGDITPTAPTIVGIRNDIEAAFGDIFDVSELVGQTRQAVEALEEVYGDTASAATSAAAAAASEAAAVQAKAEAVIAKGEAQASATTAAQKALDAAGSATAADDARAASVVAKGEAQGAASDAAADALLAAQKAGEALGSANSAAGSASTASTKATEAGNSAAASLASSVTATTAKDAAVSAKDGAETARGQAQSSATAAATSASSAAASETAAGQFASAADTSHQQAQTARAGAEAAQSSAADSATTATGAAATATQQAGLATSAKNASETAAQASVDARDQAASFADDAEVSANASSAASVTAVAARQAAEDARDQSQSAATASAGSASTAATKATEAGNSATAANAAKVAAESARDTADQKATAAASSASSAATSSTQAGQSASAAQTAKTDAETARAQAQTSASNAADAATNAAGSAATASSAAGQSVTAKDQAQGFANAANTSAQNAAGSATAAGNSASAANTSKTAAEAAYGASLAAAMAGFPDVIAADLLAQGQTGAPATRPRIPAAQVANGVYSPPVGQSGTAYFAQYVPWEVGKVYEVVAEIEGVSAASGVPHAIIYGNLNDAAYARLVDRSSGAWVPTPVGQTTRLAYRIGLGVLPPTKAGFVSTNWTGATGAAWVNLGPLFNRASGGGAQAGAQSRLTKLTIRDVTAVVAAEQAADKAVIQGGNQGFEDGLTGWHAGISGTVSGTPLSTAHGTHYASYEGSAGVFVTTTGARRDVATEKLFPIDTARKYRIRTRFFVGPDAPVQMYVGKSSRLADGSAAGSNVGLGYDAVSGTTFPAGTGWVERTSGIITGETAEGSTGASNTFRYGTKFIRLIALLNFGAAAGGFVGLDGIWLEDVTESENAKAQATASATSAASAAASATLAGEKASAAQASATAADTSRGQAQTAASQASQSETNAAGSAASAGSSATNAANSRDAAAGSATAAAGSASTANTKATEAGNSAAAAAASQVSASAAKDAAVSAAVVTMPDGIRADTLYSGNAAGAPDTRPNLSGVVNGVLTSGVGANGTAFFKAVVPWVVGQVYEVAIEVEGIAGSVAPTASPYALRLKSDYANATHPYEYYSFVNTPAGQTTRRVIRFGLDVAPPAPSGIAAVKIVTSADTAFVRFGALFNYGSASDRQSRLKLLTIRNVTTQLAAESSATAAATSASSASASATTAGEKAASASGSAVTAATKAGEALSYAYDAATSAANAQGAAESIATSIEGLEARTANTEADIIDLENALANETMARAEAVGQLTARSTHKPNLIDNPSGAGAFRGWSKDGSPASYVDDDRLAGRIFVVYGYMVSQVYPAAPGDQHSLGFMASPVGDGGHVRLQYVTPGGLVEGVYVGAGGGAIDERRRSSAPSTAPAGTTGFRLVVAAPAGGVLPVWAIKVNFGSVATDFSDDYSATVLAATVTEQSLAIVDLENQQALAAWQVVAEASGGKPARIGLASSTLGSFVALDAPYIFWGDNTVFDDATDTLQTTVGGRIRVMALGAPFGASGNLIEWWGPTGIGLSAMTTGNGYNGRMETAPYVFDNVGPAVPFKVTSSHSSIGATRSGTGIATTALVTFRAEGAAGPVRFDIYFVDGDNTVTATSTSSSDDVAPFEHQTAFRATLALGQQKTARFVCAVRDAAGNSGAAYVAVGLTETT